MCGNGPLRLCLKCTLSTRPGVAVGAFLRCLPNMPLRVPRWPPVFDQPHPQVITGNHAKRHTGTHKGTHKGSDPDTHIGTHKGHTPKRHTHGHLHPPTRTQGDEPPPIMKTPTNTMNSQLFHNRVPSPRVGPSPQGAAPGPSRSIAFLLPFHRPWRCQ